MATYNFDDLKTTYNGLEDAFVVIKVAGKSIGEKKNGVSVSDIYVDLTSGYEASIAEFSIYNVYDKAAASFNIDSNLKKFLTLGAKVEIATGYGRQAKIIFVGAIMRVNYRHGMEEIPCIRVTAMDVKGIMMSSTYSRQLKASCYSGAVQEILEKSVYTNMQSSGIIEQIRVTDTPDKENSGLRAKEDTSLGSVGALSGGNSSGSNSSEATDRTIEMVAESDYEFIVKAAKRYNYEFFTECGSVYFRKAKSDTDTRLVVTPGMGMYSFDISYDVTGVANQVTVRATDVSKAKLIQAVQKNQNSLPSKAKTLIKGSEKVYIDATATSKEEAEYRAQSLMDQVAYRFGAFECEIQGLPEYLPGYFMELSGLGEGIDNTFYINRTIHQMTTDGKYLVKLEGKAAGLKE